MYRPYTTIGTNKLTKFFFTALWFLAVTVSRGVYLFFGRRDMFMDVYGLFARSMVRLEKGTPDLDSGLAYAYTGSLSRLLKFTGNRIEAVVVYQMLLQILWLILLFAGISLLFGYVAGAVAGSILALSPWLISSIFTVWPGNYYMLHFSLVLVLLGYFGNRAGKERWLANDLGRLILAATGFYVGVLCIWNVLGLFLAFTMIYILLRNYFWARKERLRENTEEFSREEKAAGPEPKERGMGAGTQAIVLLEGILIGIFVTLMKYTGVTGEAVAGQIRWWFSQLKDPFAQYREMQIPLICRLLGAVGAGILCRLLWGRVNHFLSVKNLHRAQRNKEMPSETEGAGAFQKRADYGRGAGKEMAVQGEEGRFITTGDGRRIKLLDNPLPGPKKHIKRKMDFDLEDFDLYPEEEAKDDFDIAISKDDDFDI